jgi:uncharacterized protein YukE
MSTIKLNIQLFGGGGGWTEGVTQSAVQATYDAFSAKIDDVQTAILNYGPVDSALAAGWSGQDCQMYCEKFHQHAQNVCNHIEDYRTAVKATIDSIISQWESFQAGLIS